MDTPTQAPPQDTTRGLARQIVFGWHEATTGIVISTDKQIDLEKRIAQAIRAERAEADRREAAAAQGATLRYIRIHALRRAMVVAHDLLERRNGDDTHRATQVLDEALDADTANRRMDEEARNV